MIIHHYLRKLRHVYNDPVLRQWIIGYLLGRWSTVANQVRSVPPYLENYTAPNDAPAQLAADEFKPGTSREAIILELPGEKFDMDPGSENDIFCRYFEDTETLLALHRFAWIPALKNINQEAWVVALWQAWCRKFSMPDDDWPWHPYTTSERLVNILSFIRCVGLIPPQDKTLEILGRHGPAIFKHLEYFGEEHTGNHLANNGRGLFLAGLWMNNTDWADIGGRILIEEANRIFAPSGILREGSSHYHFLVSRWYVDCWLAARQHDRPERAALEEIVRRNLAVLPELTLPGGLPLIGDVSPDCPPKTLNRILEGEYANPWTFWGDEDRAALGRLRALSGKMNLKTLADDGWLRFDYGNWSGIWHVAPQGWSFLPGHGHRDWGGFELHYGRSPVFRDLGRQTYGPAGDGDVAGATHNTLLIDSVESYPANKPYYSHDFRFLISGSPPSISRNESEIFISTSAFSRIRGVGLWTRHWKFDYDQLTITDEICGSGKHQIQRFFHTDRNTNRIVDGVRLGEMTLTGANRIKIREAQFWQEYGCATQATTLCIEDSVELPWLSTLIVKAN